MSPATRTALCLTLATTACGNGVGPSSTTAEDETTAAASTSSADPTTTGASTSTTAEDTTSETGSTGAPLPPVPLGPWRIMSFNIMCQSCGLPGFEDWDERIPHIGDTIRRHAPALLGTQELFTADDVALIEAEIPDYTSLWFKAPDPDSLDYADAAIFYRSDMFEEQEHGFYWLSPNPDVPYSTGFATPQFARLVVWARLRALDGDAEFIFATTHFDNNSPSQELSAPLVLERTAALGDRWPVIMVGDFNSQPTDEAYTLLTGAFTDTFELAGDWRSETNLDPKPTWDPTQRIDHMFVAGAPWQASDWTVDQWGYGPNLHETSDHFAISVQVEVP